MAISSAAINTPRKRTGRILRGDVAVGFNGAVDNLTVLFVKGTTTRDDTPKVSGVYQFESPASSDSREILEESRRTVCE
jgi:hypothetical protein